MEDKNMAELQQELKALVAEIVEVEVEEVTYAADFVEDLGMDSMQALEIMAAIEKKYSIQIPEDSLGEIMNLSGLIEVADKIIKGN